MLGISQRISVDNFSKNILFLLDKALVMYRMGAGEGRIG